MRRKVSSEIEIMRPSELFAFEVSILVVVRWFAVKTCLITDQTARRPSDCELPVCLALAAFFVDMYNGFEWMNFPETFA